ncbi:MAG TPA: hypothetical protein VKR56_01325 [Candidatus Cybelea sp.]|nr:hypothetical protein [Candidatus Cybelea sp.]
MQNQTISDLSALQWDGKYVAVGGFANLEPTIYRINGAGGQTGPVLDSRRKIIGVYDPSQGEGEVSYWKYPSGHGPLKAIGSLNAALGVTVSLAPAPKRRQWPPTKHFAPY